jgi:alkylated DNA repair dioxygenase AlkB
MTKSTKTGRKAGRGVKIAATSSRAGAAAARTSTKPSHKQNAISGAMLELTHRVELDVPGLVYYRDCLTAEAEKKLIAKVDSGTWSTDLKRRVQHFGFTYDYRRGTVADDAYLGALPQWLADLGREMSAGDVLPFVPDEVLINEYEPGQGISAHVDKHCFEATIASISLGSACIMDFTKPGSGEKHLLLLEPRSLLVMSGPARYDWRHAIAGRKKDRVAEQWVARGRRISLTYRKVIKEGK